MPLPHITYLFSLLTNSTKSLQRPLKDRARQMVRFSWSRQHLNSKLPNFKFVDFRACFWQFWVNSGRTVIETLRFSSQRKKKALTSIVNQWSILSSNNHVHIWLFNAFLVSISQIPHAFNMVCWSTLQSLAHNKMSSMYSIMQFTLVNRKSIYEVDSKCVWYTYMMSILEEGIYTYTHLCLIHIT